MTRVLLIRWEWECCGDAFAVGDDVDFGIAVRSPDSSIVDFLGRDLAASVDALESHHEEQFDDRVIGRVAAVHAVTHEITQRRMPRRPGHGAPIDAAGPLGEMVEIVVVAGTVQLEPRRGVLIGVADRTDLSAPAAGHPDSHGEGNPRSVAGWLVDVEERGDQIR